MHAKARHQRWFPAWEGFPAAAGPIGWLAGKMARAPGRRSTREGRGPPSLRAHSSPPPLDQPTTRTTEMSDNEIQAKLDQRPQIVNTVPISTEDALADVGKLKGKVVLVTGE